MSTIKDDRLGKTIYADNIKLVKGTVVKTPVSSVEKAGLQLLNKDRSVLYDKLNQIGSDSIATPLEKRVLDREWSSIITGKSTTLQKAEEYGITGQSVYTDWLSAFSELKTVLDIILDPLHIAENTDISKLGNISQIFETYYNCKNLVDEQLFRAETGIIGGLDDRVKFTVEITGPNAIPISGSSVTLSSILLQDGEDVTSTYQDSDFTWQRISEDTDADVSWREGASQIGKDISVSKADLINGYATFICKFKHYYSDTLFFFKTGTFPVSIEVPGEDAISIQILSLNGSTFRSGLCNTTLVASVWKGTEDITDTIDDFHFSWERTSSDSTADESWNTSSKALFHKRLDLTPEDVIGRAVFVCNVDI